MNKREFLKGLILFIPAGGLLGALAKAAGSAETAAGAAATYDPAKHYYGMGIEIDKCIGCNRCVEACKAENNVPQEPFFFRTWVERYVISKDDEVTVESISVTGRKARETSEEDREVLRTFFVPKLCNQCANPPCVQVCPVGATFSTPDGVVLVDGQRCIGCRYCIQACPYGCRFLNPHTETAEKCSLCYHRITKGLTTACCEACPTGARQLADLKNPKDPIHEFLRTHTVQVLKPYMATGAKLFYNDLDGSVR